MKTRTLSLALSACAGFLALLLFASCQQPPQPLEVTVWHTELDPDASRLIDQLAKDVEDYFQGRVPGYTPIVSVSALSWGDVATRILQEKSSPPDLTHLEPFMVYQTLREYSEPGGFALAPIDDFLDRIELENQDTISPAVRRLHHYSSDATDVGDTYGVAYAVGTTFIAYRNDWNKDQLPEPRTWDDLLDFADSLASHGPEGARAFILPGKSPFFIDQLTNEILVSLGGSLYDQDRPNFETEELRKALHLLQDMIARTGGEYSRTTYLQQFDLLPEGKGAVVPVTYGRASKQIDNFLEKQTTDEAELATLRKDFRAMRQPGKDGTTLGVATIDAEPWVVITRKRDDPERDVRRQIVEEFLMRFYSRDFYLEFCETVPIHLRPVFVDMTEPYEARANQVRWSHWGEVSRAALERPNGTAPILMDPGAGESRTISFALSLQRTDVISDMVQQAYAPVAEALKRHLAGRNVDNLEELRREAIDEAIKRAAVRAEQLYREAN